jgi:hypothetical protein
MRRHDEWVSTSQPEIFDIPLREYTSEEKQVIYDHLKTRPDWTSAPMPAEYLVKIVGLPKGAPCNDWMDYSARIELTIEDEYLTQKDWDYPGSRWQGLNRVWIAQALKMHALDDALEMAMDDDGIDWQTFDYEMTATLNKYIADLEALPDHDGECYEDRGEY